MKNAARENTLFLAYLSTSVEPQVEGGFRILVKCILASALLVFHPIIRCHIAQSGQEVVSIGSSLSGR